MRLVRRGVLTLPLWLLCLAPLGGCRVFSGGLSSSDAEVPDDAAAGVDARPDLGGSAARPDRPRRLDVPPAEAVPPIEGAPSEVGCADGSREGFADLEAWPGIAGCSGAWNHPGLIGEARRPRCGRAAGDRGANPTGEGCGVADLCAEGWHVCTGPDDVARHSASDCESAAPVGSAAFFVTAIGASPQGVCVAQAEVMNDLHGCGSVGQPETEDCAPLERRFSFADCLASGGLWRCGGPVESLREAALVTKSPGPGGALCCRD